MGTDVMIVEDECDIAAATLEYLEAAGLTARHVTSAEEALRVLPEVSPRVILLDVNLPAMNGFTFCRTVRAGGHPDHLRLRPRLGRRSDPRPLRGRRRLRHQALLPRRAPGQGPPRPRPLDRLPDAEPTSDFDDGRLRVEEATGRTWLGGEELHLTTIEASW